MAAAATAHPFSGGRGISSAQQAPVEAASFAPQTGVNDNSILHYQDDGGGLNPDGRRKESFARTTQTPQMARNAAAFTAAELESDRANAAAMPVNPTLFANMVEQGIHGYERAQNLVGSYLVRAGSQINQLS